MNPPSPPADRTPRLLRTLFLVTLATVRSLVVILIVAFSLFALRHPSLDLPALGRAAQDNRSLILIVFIGVWVWRFWQARRRPSAPPVDVPAGRD